MGNICEYQAKDHRCIVADNVAFQTGTIDANGEATVSVIQLNSEHPVFSVCAVSSREMAKLCSRHQKLSEDWVTLDGKRELVQAKMLKQLPTNIEE